MFTRVCMSVGSATYTTGLYQVPLDAARSMVPDDYFRVAEVFPDKAVFFIGTGEFRQCALGPYREMYLGFYTENREREEAATLDSNLEEFSRNESRMYMWKNWVTTSAALDRMHVAGSTVFRRGEIDRHDEATHTTFSMSHPEEGKIRFSTPRASEHVASHQRMKRVHYGRLHGEPSRCTLDLDIDDMVTSPGQGSLELEGRVAEECAILGPLDQPLVAIWIGEMRFDMHKPLLLPTEPRPG
ncbi:MAG: hypothetical protein CL910_05345 [Deltaproteobacteria bacterium]|jgi:hypothetical protein|nr:hypothetical protein [Deltaproteobacteria bacterium]